MKTVTSISGGKTSAYMAVYYPTDYYIFSVVLTNQKEAAPKDKGLLRECQNRISWFNASRELDQTLINVLKLEQVLGKKIDWVAANFTFDDLIFHNTIYPGYRNNKTILPNSLQRICTERLKLHPIFWHCFLNWYDGIPLMMNIGFRWDEPKRVENWNCDKDKFKYPFSCSLQGERRWRNKSVEWRVSAFPLYENKITKLDVIKYWHDKGWKFPSVSNCDFCFHHRPVQQQVQADLHPDRAKWWIDIEERSNHSFGKKPLKDILLQPLLPGVFENESDFACHCTD